MPRRRASSPASPLEIAHRRAAEREAAADPANWGADPAALKLNANADVELATGARGRVTRARRVDVFDQLAGRGALPSTSLGAVRRLQEDVARLHRTLAGARQVTPRVDVSRNPKAFAEAHLQAGARIAAVMDLAGPASARLLSALIEPHVALGQAIDWRSVVRRETGEQLADAQTAVLRLACENLAGAYRRLDRLGDRRPG